MFGKEIIKISDKLSLHCISISEYSSELINLITDEIGKILNGDLSSEDIVYVKMTMKKWLNSKKDGRAKNGYVAEFICHLYLRHIGFNQYSLFKNLEDEKAPKKGFDGLYHLNREIWLVESKSSARKNVTHNNKISEAYNDLKNKLNPSDEENNPWENAKNHISSKYISEDMELEKAIDAFNRDYKDKKIHPISEYNIIPCSTIYLGNNWKKIDGNALKLNIEKLIQGYEGKNIQVICVNKKSINDFLAFING